LKEYDASLPKKLVEWFEETFKDVVGMDSVVDICNATPGSDSPADALNWTGLHACPFLPLHPQETSHIP
jgi:hypothetical protein